MRYRPLLKTSQWSELVGIPFDEEGLIRHFTLSGEDIDRVLARRGENNQLGFAVQLCLMRYPGRSLGPTESPPSAMLEFVAQQLELNPGVFDDYARRDETRRDHAIEIQHYLGLHTAERNDRRAALVAAATAADATDDGMLIAGAMIRSLRERSALLPSIDTLDRISDLQDAALPATAPMQHCWMGQQPSNWRRSTAFSFWTPLLAKPALAGYAKQLKHQALLICLP